MIYYFKIKVFYEKKYYYYILASSINNPPFSTTLFICLERLTKLYIPYNYINPENIKFEKLYSIKDKKIDIKYINSYKILTKFNL